MLACVRVCVCWPRRVPLLVAISRVRRSPPSLLTLTVTAEIQQEQEQEQEQQRHHQQQLQHHRGSKSMWNEMKWNEGLKSATLLLSLLPLFYPLRFSAYFICLRLKLGRGVGRADKRGRGCCIELNGNILRVKSFNFSSVNFIFIHFVLHINEFDLALNFSSPFLFV